MSRVALADTLPAAPLASPEPTEAEVALAIEKRDPLYQLKQIERARLLPFAREYIAETEDPLECTVEDFVDHYELQTILTPEDLLSLMFEARAELPQLCDCDHGEDRDDPSQFCRARHCDAGSLDYPRPTIRGAA